MSAQSSQGFKVQCFLPDDLVEQFKEEMRSEDRDIASMLRRIVRLHYEQKRAELLQKRVSEQAKQLEAPLSSIPHFRTEKPDPQDDAAR